MFYQKYKHHYEDYVKYGGFPEAVLEPNHDKKISYLKEIVNSYLVLDVKLLSDFSVIDDLYKLVRLLSAHSGSRLDFTKSSSILGINRNKVRDYVLLLENTYFINSVQAYTSGVDCSIALGRKIYFSDPGLLTVLGQPSGGFLFETAIAAQLKMLGRI